MNSLGMPTYCSFSSYKIMPRAARSGSDAAELSVEEINHKRPIEQKVQGGISFA